MAFPVVPNKISTTTQSSRPITVHKEWQTRRKSAPATTTTDVTTLYDHLNHTGVARVRRNSPYRGQADRTVARGDAVRVLPGVIAAAALAYDPTTLIRALWLWDPNTILTGKAALIMHGMTAPNTHHVLDFTGITSIEACSLTRHLSRPGITVHRWHIPDRFITYREHIRLTTPEVCVLILAIHGNWDWVCEALRQRLVSPGSCRAARKSLTGRYPKTQVDQALADIALNAWSIPELHMARLLRATGITGHKSNHEIHAGNRIYYLDQAFNAEKLATEIDGRTIHGTIDGYEHTMMRTAHLEQHGWKILHITPTMLRHHPHFVLDWITTHLHIRHKPTRHYTEPQLRHIMTGLDSI